MTEELPDGWALTTIDELCELNPKHSSVEDSTEVSFVPMAAVSETDGRILGTETRRYREVKKGYTHFADGDVIFAKITPCMENGKAASARGLTNGLACGTTEFFVFRSRGAVDQDYLFHFIRQENYRRAARATMQSGVGQARVPKKFVLNTELPLPPLMEQRRIVAKIEELTARSRAARAALSDVPAMLEQFRQSVLASAFRSDLTADWRAKHPDTEPASELLARVRTERRKLWEAKYPKKKYVEPDPVDETDLPELPEGWCWARTEIVCEFITKGTTPPSDRMRSVGPVPFIKVYNLTFDGKLNFAKDPTFIDLDTHRTGVMARSRIVSGDVLMNLVGPPLGKVSLIPASHPESNCNQAIAIYRPVVGLSPDYLCMALLQSELIYRTIRQSKATAGQHNLTLEMARDFCFPLAPFEEQQHLCCRVREAWSTAERLRQSAFHQLDELDQLDQSILAKAFRGEMVPQDPTDEPASVLLERVRSGQSEPKAPKSITRGKLSRIVLLLLHHWNNAASRELVDRGVLLMLDDDLRQRLASGGSKPKRKKRGTPTSAPPISFPHLLGAMIDAGFVTAKMKGPDQALHANPEVAKKAHASADAADLARLRETMKVMELIEEKQLDAELAEAFRGQEIAITV